jgi:speckle-type POZ protein
LASDWGVRLTDGYMSDMAVAAGASSFHCHKIVLTCARSDVFMAMFSHENVRECADGNVILEEDPVKVGQFLNILYTDEMKDGLNAERAGKLLAMADKYNVQKLKITCSHFLTEHMDADNCCKVLLSAQNGNCGILEKHCCTFIGKNVGMIMKTEGRKGGANWLLSNQPRLVQTILEKMAITAVEQK